MLVGVTAFGPFTRPNADKYANLAAGPLVDDSLVQGLGRGVKVADTVVMEPGLANLYRLKRQADSARRTTRLPYLAVELGGWFFSRIVGS